MSNRSYQPKYKSIIPSIPTVPSIPVYSSIPLHNSANKPKYKGIVTPHVDDLHNKLYMDSLKFRKPDCTRNNDS